jgi:aminoglycoside phosphotransferase family enzyme/predicted kinase
MSAEVAELLEQLRDPAAYPYPVAEVEVCQTHLSLAFLAGPFVYKVRKTVHFEFADFSTRELRRVDCEKEVRLNRRLAPAVYLGVVPVTQRGARLVFEGDGEPVDWAVKMQRLPAGATLREHLRRGTLLPEHVERLARRIAAFHQSAERVELPQGAFAAVANNLRRNLESGAEQQGSCLAPAVYQRLLSRTEELLARHRDLLDRRGREGWVRDLHGDLHLDHLYLFPEREPPDDLVIIDCIEFNDRLRFIDVVADMAFTVMDLRYEGRDDLANRFIESYFAARGDVEGRELLPLCTSYRAAVRGVVDGLKAVEEEVAEPERAQALYSSRAHWLLALVEAEPAERRPCLLLVAGLPGSGKSTLARGLATRSEFTLLRSDEVRKELAGLDPTTPASPEQVSPLYSDAMSATTYAELLCRAEALLFEGGRVLIDANFRRESQRTLFLDLARRWCVPIRLLICTAEPEVIRTRLARRRGDASDADWTVYQQLAATWEPPGPRSQPVAAMLTTDGTADEVLERACAVLKAKTD